MQEVKFFVVFRLVLLPAGGVRVRVSPAAGVNPAAEANPAAGVNLAT